MKTNLQAAWLYREIDLANLTAPSPRFHVQPGVSYPWRLERIQGQYESDSEDPSVFATVEWKLSIIPLNQILNEDAVSLPCTMIPGIFDQTAGDTRPKEYVFKSPLIDWTVPSHDAITVEFQNYIYTGTLKLLFIGQFIMPKTIN